MILALYCTWYAAGEKKSYLIYENLSLDSSMQKAFTAFTLSAAVMRSIFQLSAVDWLNNPFYLWCIGSMYRSLYVDTTNVATTVGIRFKSTLRLQKTKTISGLTEGEVSTGSQQKNDIKVVFISIP